MLPSYGELLARYRRKHGKFVEPIQGFESLHESLWLAYSLARRRGFTDMGTYNPNSKLPSGAPSDHAHFPAYAFDVGRKNRFFMRGWNYLVARRLFNLYVKNARSLNVEYVILGDRIWSRARGLHSYGPDRSHFWHVHVSGHH